MWKKKHTYHDLLYLLCNIPSLIHSKTNHDCRRKDCNHNGLYQPSWEIPHIRSHPKLKAQTWVSDDFPFPSRERWDRFPHSLGGQPWKVEHERLWHAERHALLLLLEKKSLEETCKWKMLLIQVATTIGGYIQYMNCCLHEDCLFSNMAENCLRRKAEISQAPFFGGFAVSFPRTQGLELIDVYHQLMKFEWFHYDICPMDTEKRGGKNGQKSVLGNLDFWNIYDSTGERWSLAGWFLRCILGKSGM